MKKKITIREQLEETVKEMISSFDRWKYIRDNGCNDPFWTDGHNMNLVRNHILYYKQKIADICTDQNFDIPEEYFIPTPPEVNQYFMSNLKQSGRVQSFRNCGWNIVTAKPKYNETQLSLF